MSTVEDDIKNTILSSNITTIKTNTELKAELIHIWNNSLSYTNTNCDKNDLELIDILKSIKHISELQKEINHEINSNSFDINKIVSLFDRLDTQFHHIPNPNTEIGDNNKTLFLIFKF